MVNNNCSQCGANLINSYCEYCGWNISSLIPEKTIVLYGIICDLSVSKESSIFKPKIGSPILIANSEISHVSLKQAPLVGTGDFSVRTITGVQQNITFLYQQNQNMNEIASYLLQITPTAQFINIGTEEQSVFAQGITCPKCKNNNTTVSNESRKFSIWKIVIGIFTVIMGFGSMSGGVGISLFVIVLGTLLALNGFGIIGKKKINCFCANCRKRFRA